MLYIPPEAEHILSVLRKNGYEACLVGGCVRDMLMDITPHDYDITTSAPPEITLSLFEKTVPTGIKHGTVTVIENGTPFEVTTYRSDGKYSDCRRPESVTFVKSLREDLARRDFVLFFGPGGASLPINRVHHAIDPHARFWLPVPRVREPSHRRQRMCAAADEGRRVLRPPRVENVASSR